jgi:hypothetical protein
MKGCQFWLTLFLCLLRWSYGFCFVPFVNVLNYIYWLIYILNSTCFPRKNPIWLHWGPLTDFVKCAFLLSCYWKCPCLLLSGRLDWNFFYCCVFVSGTLASGKSLEVVLPLWFQGQCEKNRYEFFKCMTYSSEVVLSWDFPWWNIFTTFDLILFPS